MLRRLLTKTVLPAVVFTIFVYLAANAASIKGPVWFQLFVGLSTATLGLVITVCVHRALK